MAKVSTIVTINSGSPVSAFPAGTMCRNVFAQPRHGTTGLVYVGGPLLNKTTGVDLYSELTPGNPSTTPGAAYVEQSQADANVVDAGSYRFDGDVTGEKVVVVATTE